MDYCSLNQEFAEKVLHTRDSYPLKPLKIPKYIEHILAK